MRVRYVSSSDEFTYAKFPTAKSVEEWCLTYAKVEPLRVIGGDTSWQVEWQVIQRFSPEPVPEIETEDT